MKYDLFLSLASLHHEWSGRANLRLPLDAGSFRRTNLSPEINHTCWQLDQMRQGHLNQRNPNLCLQRTDVMHPESSLIERVGCADVRCGPHWLLSLYFNPVRSKPIVAKTFPDALRYLVEGRPFGRVVLTIWQPLIRTKGLYSHHSLRHSGSAITIKGDYHASMPPPLLSKDVSRFGFGVCTMM
jgi:hypothetical protein